MYYLHVVPPESVRGPLPSNTSQPPPPGHPATSDGLKERVISQIEYYFR